MAKKRKTVPGTIAAGDFLSDVKELRRHLRQILDLDQKLRVFETVEVFLTEAGSGEHRQGDVP